jgi:hypothetical protein
MRDVALISADITPAADASNNETVSNERLGNERMGNERLGNERIGNERLGNERMGNERMGNPPVQCLLVREPKCVRVASVAGLARVCDAFTASHAAILDNQTTF